VNFSPTTCIANQVESPLSVHSQDAASGNGRTSRLSAIPISFELTRRDGFTRCVGTQQHGNKRSNVFGSDPAVGIEVELVAGEKERPVKQALPITAG
jgi:hypothetical protein